MSIEEYERKRRFEKTPEPRQSTATSRLARRKFCLQRHQASRLHYDLRLEIDGVLRSWAVPKGPSLTPLEKRLAVPTEDHPLAYLDWEGVIPAGEYGAGVMMVYDIGDWEPVLEQDAGKQLEAGELKIRLWGSKVQGESTLVRTNLDGSWLWIKKEDAWADPDWQAEDHLWSAVSGRTPEEIELGLPTPNLDVVLPAGALPAPLPLELEPMLAEPAKPFDDPQWVYELKWDGIRALAFAQQNSLRVAGRRGTALTGRFPELTYLRAHLKAESFVLDGELVVLDASGRPDFSRILSRLKAPSHRALGRLARSDKATYYIFDLLYLNGHDLRGVGWEERRRLLLEVFRPSPWLRISEAVPEAGTALFALTLERGLEGLVAKERNSLYQSGRSSSWKKLKARHTCEAIVVGYTPHRGQGLFGALHLARNEGGRLVSVGKVGSGFTSTSSAQLMAQLTPRETPLPVHGLKRLKEPVTWVEPSVVVEVEFAELTKEGAVRHASFVRLRPDLAAGDCSDSPPDGAQAYLEIEGRSLTISNPSKVLFPCGADKDRLVHYYQLVAPLLLPHLRDRPLSLRRFPDGVQGPDFFQKHPPPGSPAWLRTEPTAHGVALLAEDQASLVYLANLACIEFHSTLSRLPHLDTPDGLLLDLDPQEAPFSLVKSTAWAIYEILQELGWSGFVKTSGSRGLHVFVPLAHGYTFEQSRMMASLFAEVLHARKPGQITTERVPAKRPKGTVYIDAPQNRSAATTASAYTVRATPAATLSMPLHWSDLETDVSPEDFTLQNLPQSLADTSALWSLQPQEKQRIEEALQVFETLA